MPVIMVIKSNTNRLGTRKHLLPSSMKKKGKLRRVTARATGPSTPHHTKTSPEPHSDVAPTSTTAHLSPTAIMSDVALWCLIGDSTPFEVTAPVNATIYRLKELVWEKRKRGTLKNVDASDLILWKVCTL